MILVPCSLFRLSETDGSLRRRESDSENAGLDGSPLQGTSMRRAGGTSMRRAGGTSSDLCYYMQGQLLIEVLCLWRDSPLGVKHFTPLSQSEISTQTFKIQNLPSGLTHPLSSLEVDKFGHSIGIDLASGDFTRNPLLWHNMCSLDGSFYIERNSVLVTEVDRGTSFKFILKPSELSEIIAINRSSSLNASESREDMFLRGTIALLNEKHSKELQETDVYRRQYYRYFPAPNELMMYGYLKKRNKNLGWKERFVALAPGKMFYVEKASVSSTNSAPPIPGVSTPLLTHSSSGSIIIQSSPSPSSASGPKVIALVPGRTWCRPASESVGTGTASSLFTQARYDSDRVFELLVSNDESNVTKYHWACDSKEERDRWLHLIQAAASLGARETVLQQQNDACIALRIKVNKCESVDDFLPVLRELHGSEVSISVDYIQASLNRARGEMDASLDQTAKDTARDSVIVNGQVVTPCKLTTLMGTLVNQMTTTLGTQNMQWDETGSALMDFARLVVLATNRTQCGGLALEGASLLLLPPNGGTLLVPLSSDPTKKSSPITVEIEKPSLANQEKSPGVSSLTPLTLPDSELTAASSSNGVLSAPSSTTNASTTGSDSAKQAPGSEKKRRFHMRTVSDPQSLLKFISSGGLSSASSAQSTAVSGSSNGSDTTTSAAAPTASKTTALTASAGSVTPLMSPMMPMLPGAPPSSLSPHNPASPKNSLMRGLSMRKKTIESEGLMADTAWYEEHIKLRVTVRAEMDFQILSESDLTHRLALFRAIYSRTFCLVEGRSFAVDQGTIVLVLSDVASSPESPSTVSDLKEEDVESETDTLVRRSVDDESPAEAVGKSGSFIVLGARQSDLLSTRESEFDEQDLDVDYNEL